MLGNLKIWVRLVVGVSLILVIAGSSLVVWATLKQRDTAIQQARDFSMSLHQMTVSSLTGMMITGTIGQRAVFLDQVRQSEEIRSLSVIRSEALAKQFGPGEQGETRSDATELKVLQSQEPYFEVEAGRDGESLRAIIPVVARKNYLGKDCLMCHIVPEGTTLGVVSMRISLDKVNQAVSEFRAVILLAAIALMLPVIAFLYFAVKHSVTLPLHDVTRRLQDITEGEGDLTRRLEIKGEDEICAMARAFNGFMEKLQGIVGEVKASAGQVLNTADQLASLSERVATNSTTATSEAYAMAAQVEVMTYTLNDLANQAEDVQRVSLESSDHSARGGEVIHAAAHEMNQITAAVNDSSQIIHDLGRQSDQISQIVNVIREIADQTNLLALNAAIEAARAGEQGRGFAVVADEVRTLAERTSNSTQEIAGMIVKIQDGTHQAIESMTTGVARVSAGAALAQQAGEAINQIKSGVSQVVAGVNEISASLKDQSLSNNENSQKVEHIAKLSEQNSTAFQETARTVQHIDALARNLGNLVGRFRT